MDTYAIALWALLGFALSTWFMMHIWLPDPPPNVLAKYITILVAGAVGGVIGGFLAHGRASSDPMPAIIGAAAGGLFLSGAVGFLTGAGQRAAR
jgi:thiol:disulfide interchange protein